MQIVLLSAIAGIVGTGLGGLASVILLRRSTKEMTCWLLSFAAGIMISVVCFGLIRESVELAGITVSAVGLVAGLLVLMLLNRLVDVFTASDETDHNLHHTHEELYHELPIIQNKSKMFRSGIIMIIAIGLHNFPEGMAIGAGGGHSINLGITLATIILVHNIPEGMAIATPLLTGGVGKGKVIFLTALSGAPTLLGGIIGLLLGGISDFTVALVLSVAGGAMLYVVFGEIIPQSIIMVKNRTASIITLLGIIIGLIVSYL